MRTKTFTRIASAALLLIATAGMSVIGEIRMTYAQAPQERLAQSLAQADLVPTQAPARVGQPDGRGFISAPGAAPAALPPPTLARACLQLHNGAAVFNFDVTFDPNVTGFPILSGTISGTLCNASQWVVSGGHLGPNLSITAVRPSGPPCASQLTVAGNFANPSSYTGTYGFPGAGFQQHTLFLGYQKPTCP